MNTLDTLEQAVKAATPGEWNEASWQLGQINYPDAHVIALLRNHADALIAVARAAGKYAGNLGRRHYLMCKGGDDNCDCGGVELWEALAKLEGGGA